MAGAKLHATKRVNNYHFAPSAEQTLTTPVASQELDKK
jgi:hypothetical protein